jgi:hypothetical protein
MHVEFERPVAVCSFVLVDAIKRSTFCVPSGGRQQQSAEAAVPIAMAGGLSRVSR